MSKGQVNSVDLVVSMMIFIIVLTIGLIVWNTAYARINDLESTRSAHETAFVITNQLTKGPGAPISWNTTNVIQVGLADKQNIITFSKWNALHAYNNTELNDKLGSGNYRSYLVLKMINDTVIDTLGTPLNSSTKLAAAMLSYVVYNSTVAKLEVIVWQ